MTAAFALEEGDLCLRGMQPRDAPIVQRCRNLPEVARYQSWRPPTVAEVVELAHEQIGRAPGMQQEPFQVVIEWSDSNGERHVVGDMGTGAFDPGRQMEIGIVLDPAWHGRGLATRACELLFDHLFESGLHRITARVDLRNGASERLFERLGFRREGLEREAFWDEAWNEWADEICFAVRASEWNERRSGSTDRAAREPQSDGSSVRGEDVPPRQQVSVYPEPFAQRMVGREKRQLSKHFGLSNFGVNLTTLKPGASSALRHTHSKQDEFLWVVRGSPTLVTNEGPTVLEPGMCAGFPAGCGNAQHLVNETEEEAVFLIVGDRTPGDSAAYPDDDLQAEMKDGAWRFTHKDGTPY